MQVLQATTRAEVGRKNDKPRREGKVPAVVYGGAIDAPASITIDRNEFIRIFRSAGESTVIELNVDGKPLNALIQDYQLDPIRDEVIHADFRAVDMTEEIEAEVKLVFVNEAPAVKALGGTLLHPLETLAVRALPAKLPSSIEIDLSKLGTFDDVIRVSDLDLGEGVQAMEEPERTLAAVAPPRSDAEMEALEGSVDVDVEAVAVEGEKKEEGEGEEGEAAENKE